MRRERDRERERRERERKERERERERETIVNALLLELCNIIVLYCSAHNASYPW